MRDVRRQQEAQGRTLTVTLDDVRRLVAACRVSRNRKLAALVAMACTTGWRLGSLQGLTWGALNLKEGHADTKRTKNGYAAPDALAAMGRELRRIKPELAQPGDVVFGTANFDKAWENAIRRADLPLDWTFHHCRHIAASILAQSGASVVTIMQALNHKTPMMAMRYKPPEHRHLARKSGESMGTRLIEKIVSVAPEMGFENLTVEQLTALIATGNAVIEPFDHGFAVVNVPVSAQDDPAAFANALRRARTPRQGHRLLDVESGSRETWRRMGHGLGVHWQAPIEVVP